MKKYSKFYSSNMYLVDKDTLKPLQIGLIYKTFRGEEVVLIDGTPPHKDSSQGFVTVLHKVEKGATEVNAQEYYAGVINAIWVLEEPVDGDC